MESNSTSSASLRPFSATVCSFVVGRFDGMNGGDIALDCVVMKRMTRNEGMNIFDCLIVID